MDFFNAFAFGVGMVALINPCGFGLLPAYLGVFLGQEDDSPNRWISLSRAQVVGLAMTLGMLVVFGFFGLILGGISSIGTILPYFNILLGFGLIALGVAMFRGYQLNLKLPKMQAGGESGSFAQMFLFGMSYATASLTCTLGLFVIAINSSNFGGGSFLGGFGSLLSYGLGMGLLATMLTLALALGKSSIVGKFRQLLPIINRFSAGLLLLVGPFSILYGIWELQVLGHWPLGDGIWVWLDDFNIWLLGIQGNVSNWFSIDHTFLGITASGTSFVAWPIVVLNVIVVVGGLIARGKRKADLAALDANTPDTDAEAVTEAASV